MLNPKTLLIALLIVLLCLPIHVSARHFARWFTSMGSFASDLRDEIVPITANNFINLTNSGFYDGLIFHRVVANFVIQDGDPTGTGYGGPGYTIQDEFSPLLHHDSPGVLAMARTSAPNSAGSQYYITLAPTPHLDGSYAIFGKVYDGLDVVLAIGQVPVDGSNHPVNNVYIDSLRILDMAIYNVSPPTEEVVQFDASDPQLFVVEAFNNDLTVVFEWYIDDVLQPQFNDIMMDPVFPSNGMHTVKCVTSTDDVSWTTQWQVNVSSISSTGEVALMPVVSLATLQPNPFRHSTGVSYSLSKTGEVTLAVYDVKGRTVRSETLAGKIGLNNWVWTGQSQSGAAVAPGIYIIRVSSGGSGQTVKAILLK
jgi:cyclophilin family peptidyl-prolyl cis-trans isomerase